jgi:DNA-binding phage protein
VSCWILVPLDLGGEWHGAAWLPAEFRRKVLDLVEAGRSVAEVARDLGIIDQSIYTYKTGRRDGVRPA